MINSDGGQILKEYIDGKVKLLTIHLCKERFKDLSEVNFVQGQIHQLNLLLAFVEDAIKKKNALLRANNAE
jgi:hypothetical protein